MFLPQSAREKAPLSTPAEKLRVSCFLLPLPLVSKSACHSGFYEQSHNRWDFHALKLDDGHCKRLTLQEMDPSERLSDYVCVLPCLVLRAWNATTVRLDRDLTRQVRPFRQHLCQIAADLRLTCRARPSKCHAHRRYGRFLR